MGVFDDPLQLGFGLGLEEVPGVDLVGTAPVGDRVEIFGQRRVLEELRLLVLSVLREGEGVVRGDAAG